MTESRPVRLLTPAFVALSLSDLAYFTATGVLIAVTPLFLVGPLGSDKATVGLAMGAFSVTTLVLRPWAGRWSDRRGRRPLLVGGAALFTVVVAGHLLVEHAAVLVVLRLLLGACEALFFVAGFAALADLAPPGRAGEALSLNSLALYCGIALGPLVGQGMLDRFGFDGAWIGALLLAAVATGLASRVPETAAPAGDRPPGALIHRAAVLPGSALFVGVACMSGFFAFAVLHARDLGLQAWSVVLLVFGSVVVGCRIVFRTLPDRVPPLRLTAASLLVIGAGLLLVAASGQVAGMLVGTVVLAVGVAFLTPAVFAAVFGLVGAEERGSAAATVSVFIDLGLGGGPMVVGVAASASSIPVAFAGAGLMALVAAALVAVGLAGMGLSSRARRPA